MITTMPDRSIPNARASADWLAPGFSSINVKTDNI